MKLLLTSAGISNNSIKNSFLNLLGKKPEEASLVFIPTASNIEKGDKAWLIKDFVNFEKLNFKNFSIVDISAVDRSIWYPQIQEADVLVFGGGNTFYLMEWVEKSGLKDELLELLKTKVYVGISAGSMILSPDLMLNTLQKLYKEDLDRIENMKGVSFVDFYILPHYMSSPSSIRTKENIPEAVKEIKNKIYALDDNSALEIVDNNIKIISEGNFLEIN